MIGDVADPNIGYGTTNIGYGTTNTDAGVGIGRGRIRKLGLDSETRTWLRKLAWRPGFGN